MSIEQGEEVWLYANHRRPLILYMLKSPLDGMLVFIFINDSFRLFRVTLRGLQAIFEKPPELTAPALS
jgi:hypothetical protein